MSDEETTPAPTPYSKLPRTSVEDSAAADVARELGRGLRSASNVLRGPAGTQIEALVGDTNLPELVGEDPLGALALRVDREGNLWRNLALRELARLGWTDRFAQAVVLVAMLGEVGLGVVAALAALVGGDGAWGRALLVGVAAAALAGGAAMVVWVTSSIRRMQRDIAREALARADLSELRLHRIALLMTRRKEDPARFGDALARLEKDASAPVD